MTTLKDISRRSGYSVTTVSRALNGHDDVTAETRRGIQAIAREMNYRPNQVARKLVSGRSGMVALVIEAPPRPFEHGHFFEIVSGLSGAFSRRDMDFVLHVGGGGDPLRTYERLINRGTLDGFILTFPVLGDRRIERLIRGDVAFVVHGPAVGDDRYAFFDVDNHAISAAAADVLADHGHRRIALLAGPQLWPSVAERLRGYCDALLRRGVPFDPALVRHGDTSPAFGARAAVELMASGPDAPTALICCNSLAAAGACAALGDLGLRVPGDVSLVAHDDDLPQVDVAALDPPLTVTRAPLRAAAEPLAALLVRRIEGAPVEALQVTRRAALVPRASVGPPPRRRG